MLVRKSLAFACGVATLSASLPALAQAIPDCTTLPEYANAIVGDGGSAATPTIKAVALAIANSSAPDNEKFTIFYAQPSACVGYRAFKANDSGATQPFFYWTAAGEKTCNGTNLPVDFSHMGSEVEFCNGETKPANVGDFPAPVQTVNVITDKDSNEVSISAEALHFIYGYGQEGQVAPWTAGAGVVQRTDTSFVHNYIAAAIKVPQNAFWWNVTPGWDAANGPDPKAAFKPNTVTKNADSVTFITGYAAGAKPNETLGYISGSQADRYRTDVKTLAFKAFDQECAVYPDKNGSALDKINVRLGRYAMWAPGHFFGKIANKKLVNDKVAKLVGWFNGTEAVPGNVNITRTIIEAGDIPECAMQAYRDTAVGPIYSYAPKKPCGCFFETIATGAQPASCVACAADSECPGEGDKCNYGYCEAYRAAGESEG
jgi:hypothetical protein